MQELKLTVTVDEANLLLEGLGNLPFARVYALVSKMQEQASQQLNGELPQSSPGQASPPQVQEQRDK